MTITGQKSNQLIRIISFILLISFIAQDIVWANPEITLRYANSDKLAPESFIKKTDSHSRVAGRYTAKYHERMRVLTGVGRHIESQRSEFSKLWHRWYRTFQMKQDASLAQRDKIRRSLEHLEKILIGLARIRPKCIPDKDTDNAARLEYIKLGIREVEIRLASMIGAEGILERYPGVSDAIKKSILPDLAAFLKGRRSLPDLGYKAAILKGITKLERGKDGIRDLHPQHAMHLDIRVKLYEVAEQLSELSDEVARLSLKQAELDLKPDVVNRRAPEGAAAEAEKMEKAAIIGLIASPLSIFISIFHQSYFSWLLAISYVVFMMTLPIYTARSMKRAHAFEKIDKQFWPVMQLQKLVNLVYNKEKYGDFGYGLITPFQKARDIKDLYAHDPDSHGKLSYYSFSMEEPGKPRQAMSRLYINKQEMAYVPRFVQWILYLHEWLHGRARVKTEQLNVPLTYGLPWIAFCLALLPFVVYLDPKYLKVDLMILSYNIMVLAGARIFAALMPGKVSIAGHYLLNTESWKPLTDFEIDNIIIEHAHKVTRDQISGDMVPVRRWAKGSPGDVAELVRCDPAKSEDILVIKAAYSPKGA